jgi:hypothetical protein
VVVDRVLAGIFYPVLERVLLDKQLELVGERAAVLKALSVVKGRLVDGSVNGSRRGCVRRRGRVATAYSDVAPVPPCEVFKALAVLDHVGGAGDDIPDAGDVLLVWRLVGWWEYRG